MDTHQGSCLCGEITFEVTGQPVRQGNCHCSTCKKATGAAYATIVFFKEDQISQLSGETKCYEYMSDKSNTNCLWQKFWSARNKVGICWNV